MSPSATRLALFASLALNVFVIGFAAALFMRPLPAALLNPDPIVLGEKVAAMLPEPARGNLLLRLEAVNPVITERLADYSDVLIETATLLDADVVDSAALTAAIAEARSARADIGEQLTAAFVGTVAELPPEVRRQLVRRFFPR